MTRKDYVRIMGTLRTAYNDSVYGRDNDGDKFTVVWLARRIADDLKSDNPRFDAEHFLAVVRGERPLDGPAPTKSR